MLSTLPTRTVNVGHSNNCELELARPVIGSGLGLGTMVVVVLALPVDINTGEGELGVESRADDKKLSHAGEWLRCELDDGDKPPPPLNRADSTASESTETLGASIEQTRVRKVGMKSSMWENMARIWFRHGTDAKQRYSVVRFFNSASRFRNLLGESAIESCGYHTHSSSRFGIA